MQPSKQSWETIRSRLKGKYAQNLEGFGDEAGNLGGLSFLNLLGWHSALDDFKINTIFK